MATYDWAAMAQKSYQKAAENPGNFVVLRPGRYQAEVAKSTAGKSKAGNDMITLDFTISTGAEKGSTARYWQTIPDEAEASVNPERFEKSTDRFFRLFHDLGVNPAVFSQGEISAERLAPVLVGKNATLVVQKDEYNGRPSHRVAFVNKGRPGDEPVYDAEDAGSGVNTANWGGAPALPGAAVPTPTTPPVAPAPEAPAAPAAATPSPWDNAGPTAPSTNDGWGDSPF